MAVPSAVRLRIDHDRTAAIRTLSDDFGLGFADIVGIVENAAVATMERLTLVELALDRFLVSPVIQRMILQLFQLLGDVLRLDLIAWI